MGARRRAKPTKPRDDLFAAVLAQPDDDALRAVWADALLERGDPRGELVTIQLAHRGDRVTTASRCRELDLIETHGDDWLENLGPYFYNHHEGSHLHFDRGVFVGGTLDLETVDAAMFDHAEWRAVVTLHNARTLDDGFAFLRDPRVAHVREATGVFESYAPELVDSRAPLPFRSLGLELVTDEDDGEYFACVGACRGLPALDHLALDHLAGRTAALFATGPVIERLARMTLPIADDTRAQLAILEGRAGALREVRLEQEQKYSIGGWEVQLTRATAPGPFTRGVVRYTPVKHVATKELVPQLVALCGALPTRLHELAIDLGKPKRFARPAVEALAAAVAALTELRSADLPWRPRPRA